MDFETKLLLISIFLTSLFFWLWRRSLKRVNELKFQKHSLSTKYGKITEQFLPLLNIYPYNSSNFRFLGTPIDGVQFEEDRIIFLEFKSGDSRLNSRQNQIKHLINNKKIYFEEIYLK